MDIRGNNTFVFSQGITDVSVGNFITDLINWSQKDNNKDKPLQIIMNSGGGDVLAGIAFYAFIGELRRNGHHVTIKVMGRAGSAAAIVLQAADKRIISFNSDVLVHAVIPISQTPGSAHSQHQAELNRSQQLTDRTMGILVDRSGGKLTREMVMDKTGDKSKDWWISAEQSVEYGLVDEVEKAPAFK